MPDRQDAPLTEDAVSASSARRIGGRRAYSLTTQLLISVVAAVLITAVAAWIPESRLIRREFERQTWAQVEQGRRAARTLYNAWRGEVTNAALLTAQLPTLRQLLAAGEGAEVAAYLETVETTLALDLVLTCDGNGRVVAQIGAADLTDPCALPEPAGFHVASGPAGNQPWLLAGHRVWDEGSAIGQVVVGLRLDSPFATRMRGETELQHTLLVDGVAVATSFADGVSSRLNADVDGVRTSPDGSEQLTFTMPDGRAYYAARLTLENPRIVDEVALSATELANTRRNLLRSGIFTIVAAVLVGTLIGLSVSRRISDPLLKVDRAAVRMRDGDLESAIEVDTQIREVARVAHSMEHSRIRLRRTLASLQQEKAWVDHLLQAIVEGIVILDEENRILFFSQGAVRITGWSAAEVARRHCDEVFRPSAGDIPFSESMPPPGERRTVWVLLDEERPAALSITHARLLPPDTAAAQVALVFRDVTEEEAVQRLLNNFLSNVTHEFRTPLTALAASVELMLDQADTLTDQELEQMLNWLRLGIVGLQTLVDNLLETARMEAGHFSITPHPANLHEIITEATRLLEPLLLKYQQRLVLELPTVPLRVHADERRIVQVLINLLSNANKYGPPDSEIILRARRVENGVRVEVADRGPGVPAGFDSTLFQRFLHVDVAGDQKRAGVGLGLWVVKAIVEAHGGRVGVDPRPGGGSIFWFTIPLVEDS